MGTQAPSIGAAKLVATLVLGLRLASSFAAEPTTPPVSDGSGFTEESGALIYRGVCQACHMPEGEGAKGAGRYPALRHNEHLASADYPILIVLKGRSAMPPLGRYFSDAQVAEVVNYVRTHLENHYTDEVSAADVARLRR
ncbi:MAG: cytochrome c [Burkholderiaceae bacterium]